MTPAMATEQRRSTRRELFDAGVLLLLGMGLVVATFLVPHSGNFVVQPKRFTWLEAIQLGFYLLAGAWVLIRRPNARWVLPIIIFIALATRLVLVSGEPYASSDIYRYVWDGRVQTHGINPYRYAPQADALTPLRDSAIYPFINRRWVPTIYPPVAQFTFAAVYLIHPNSIDWTRIAFSLFDVGGMLLIALALKRVGRRPEQVVLYAWHPLAIFEIGSSGHLDVIAVLLLLVALHARLSRRPWLVGVSLAASALVKYYALVAAPALLTGSWRRDLKMAAGFVGTVALAYVPYLTVGKRVVGFLPGYLKEEGIASGGRFYLLDRTGEYAHSLGWQIPEAFALHGVTAARLYDLALLAVMGVLALWVWRRPVAHLQEIPRRILLLLLTLLILTTPTYPWYALLPLAFLPFAGRRLFLATLYASSTALILYLQWWWPGEPHWPLKVVYGWGALVFAAAALSYGFSKIPWKRLLAVAPRQSTVQTGQEA
jgi:alpha-1,6-mannosyltransferase